MYSTLTTKTKRHIQQILLVIGVVFAVLLSAGTAQAQTCNLNNLFAAGECTIAANGSSLCDKLTTVPTACAQVCADVFQASKTEASDLRDNSDPAKCSLETTILDPILSNLIRISGSPTAPPPASELFKASWCETFTDVPDCFYDPTGGPNGEPPIVPPSTPGSNLSFRGLDNPLGEFSPIDSFKLVATRIVTIVVRIATPFAVLALIWAGVLFVKAQGKPEEIKKANKTLLWTVVGIILLLGSYTIARTIQDTICEFMSGESEVCKNS